MKKIMTKIVGAFLGVAMTIGVGAAINQKANAVYASYGTPETLSCSAGTISDNQMAFSTTSFNVVHAKGTSSNFASYSPWRVYQNNTVTFSSKDGTTKIGKIEITHNGTYYGTLSVTSPTGGNVAMANSSGGTTTWSITDANATSSVSLVNTGSQSRWSSIKIYPVVAGGPSALANPNPQYNDLNKTVSWTTDEHASEYQIKVDDGSYSKITTETYDASGLEVGVDHTVYIKAVGDETNYSSTEGSVKFKPTAVFVGKEYALCTSVDDLEAGANYILTSGTSGTVKAMSTEENNNNRKATDVSVNDTTHRITSTQLTLVVELGGSEDHWTFETTNYLGTDGYFASNGSSNYLKVQNTAGEATISFTNNYAVINLGPSTTNKLLRYNSGSTLFSCYASGQQPVYLWKEYKELTGVNVTGTPDKTSYFDSESFDATGITAYEAVYSDSSTKVLSASDVKWPNLVAGMTKIKGSYTEFGTTVYTEEFNISVAADALSTVTLEGTMGQSYYLDSEWNKGSLVVTANYASGKSNIVTDSATFKYYSDSNMTSEIAKPGDLGVVTDHTVYVKATFNSVSNTTAYAQTISVSIENGTTIDNPLTVAQAMVIGNGLENNAETTKDYYIRGTVAEVDGINEVENDRWASFWLSDGETHMAFHVYHAIPTENVTSFDNLKSGAEVLLKCSIKKYVSGSKTQIEAGSSRSLLSITYVTPDLESIVTYEKSLLLGVGEVAPQIDVAIIPLGAEAALTWISSDSAVASVDQNGVVTAVSVGSATITVFDDKNSNGALDAGEFNDICSVEVFNKAVMNYVSDKTTNMAATDNAALVNLDPNMFTVDAAKGGNNNFPGLNKDDDIRAYDGNDIVVTIDSNYSIEKVTINILSGSSSLEVYANGVKITANMDGVFTINSQSFRIHANGNTVKMKDVNIFYKNATAQDYVERLSTQTSLAYRYEKDGEGNFSYSDIVMRFGANISKDLWNELEGITGFGVILMEGQGINNMADVAIAMEDMVLSTVSEDLNAHLAIDYFVPIAQMNETIGVDGDNYFWNLRVTVDEAEMNKEYAAVAYIKVGDEYVLMNMAKESVETLALDYLTSRGCDETTAGGSLQNIVEKAQ